MDPSFYLGLDTSHESVIFVTESDPNICVFKNTSAYADQNQRIMETQMPQYENNSDEEKNALIILMQFSYNIINYIIFLKFNFPL